MTLYSLMYLHFLFICFFFLHKKLNNRIIVLLSGFDGFFFGCFFFQIGLEEKLRKIEENNKKKEKMFGLKTEFIVLFFFFILMPGENKFKAFLKFYRDFGLEKFLMSKVYLYFGHWFSRALLCSLWGFRLEFFFQIKSFYIFCVLKIMSF